MRLEKHLGTKDMQFSDDMLQMLALRVTADFQSKIKDGKISVEDIQDSVENVLIQAATPMWQRLIFFTASRGKNPQHEINDPRLQRDRRQLRKG